MLTSLIDKLPSCLLPLGKHTHIPAGINIFVDFEGDLSVLQKERLLRAASECPVKKMMSGGLLINTVVV